MAPPQRAADHDRDARHGSHQGFLQEAELAVPDELDAGEDGCEQDGHADHAGREELDVVALAGFLEDRTETEAQRDQEQQRLAQRSDDAGARADIALQLAQPQRCRWRSSAASSPHLRHLRI